MMRRMRWAYLAAPVLLAASLACGPGTPVTAQTRTDATVPEDQSDSAFLVADNVVVTDDGRLIADGNVEALYDGTRLWAERIIYDERNDQLTIEGPIRIDEGNGIVVLADSAALDSGLENGLLTGARLVLDQQLQLAAVQVARAEGRYSQLSKTSVTSCQVCGKNAVPLWSIRARRVVHDQEERQLYFDGAQFRVLDIPVMYIPRLRLPDPTLERARGFLFPSVRSTTDLGTGVKVPYFLPLGDHADLTITPYLSEETRTLELRYRRAFYNGEVEFRGAVTRDALRPDDWRGYVFGEGAFELPRDFELSFDIELTSDEAYLSEYGYSGKDRLDSAISVTRARRHEYIEASLINYNSLRDDELNARQPTIIPDIRYERRYQLDGSVRGEMRMALIGHSHLRYSDADILGRDVTRATAELTWLDRWTTSGGLRIGARAGLAADQFWTGDDSTSDPDATSLTPSAALELRYPMVRGTARGARQLLEPVAQIGWSGGSNPDIANDESLRQELDEGNLLDLSRFPAPDRRERGASLVTGLRILHEDPRGWEAGLALGRVYREIAHPDFSKSSGLDAPLSDWLLAAHFRHDDGLYVMSRTIVDDRGEVSKSEARGSWSNDLLDLGAAFIILPADADEDRSERSAEWSFDGAYRLGRHWTASGDLRYDIADGRAVKAGMGLAYRNECIEANFSATRRFANSSNLDPSTSFGLTVTLKGFSTGGDAGGYSRTCTQ